MVQQLQLGQTITYRTRTRRTERLRTLVRSVEDASLGRASLESLLVPILNPLTLDRSLPHQQAGIEWLSGRARAILADDMGLGKTAQAAIAAAKLIETGAIDRGLVLAPKSLLDVWVRELAKWAPNLHACAIVPSASDKSRVWELLVSRVHIAITNYEQVRECPRVLTQAPLPLVILDEAHKIRNTETATAAGVRQIKALRLWALTGTPVENSSSDLASLLDLMGESRRSLSHLRELPIETLRSLARPLMIRRVKSDVLPQTYRVHKSVVRLELSKEQREAYEKELTVSSNRPGAPLIRNARLRQICDLERQTGASAKLDYIRTALDTLGSGDKAVVFSFTRLPLRSLAASLGSKCRLLTGAADIETRRKAVNDFSTDPFVKVLLATIGVGAEGLTLTAANKLYFVNLWWNPSTNNQARDRLIRIGQTRDVEVTVLVAKGTVEEHLLETLQRKQMLFDSLIKPTEPAN